MPKGAERFTAISDSEFAAGLAEGKLVGEDGRERFIDGGVARLSDGTICGSASSLARRLPQSLLTWDSAVGGQPDVLGKPGKSTRCVRPNGKP